MAWQIHHLTITGMNYTGIESCLVYESLGRHSQLQLRVMISQEELEAYERYELQKIGLELHKNDQEIPLFYGIITAIEIVYEAELYYAEIIAKSETHLMDLIKRCRTFQDIHMTYQQLIDTVIGSYENVNYQMGASDQEIGGLIVQYEETDWEFLKRVISQLEVTVTAAANHPGICFYAGIPEIEAASIDYKLLKAEKDLHSYYLLKDNQQFTHSQYFTNYELESDQIKNVFDQIFVNRLPFTIYAATIYLTKGEWKAIYQTRKAEGLKQQIRYPFHLIGRALKGEVREVSKSSVQVLLDIDRDQPMSGYWFPYSALSASADGSGWYFMPERGDQIRVYFPSKWMSQAIVLNAVSSYESTNGSKDRMSNPGTVYLRTKYGKELTLDSQGIMLSNDNGSTAISLNQDGTVSLRAEKNVTLAADEAIYINSDGEVNLQAEQLTSLSIFEEIPEASGFDANQGAGGASDESGEEAEIVVLSNVSIAEENNILVEGEHVIID